jgi:phospholipase C
MDAKPLLRVAPLALIAAAGCASNAGTAVPGPSTMAQHGVAPLRIGGRYLTSQYLSHVIVIIQENRSFENFFAGYPGANAPISGCVSAQTEQRVHGNVAPPTRSIPAPSPCPSGDAVVPLHQVTFNGPDLQHDWSSSIADWNNGNMDGFWKYGRKHGIYQAYEYVKPALIQPYLTMANQYVLADAMFPTEFGGSFTGHLTLVAGTDNINQSPSRAEVDFPSVPPDDCDAPPGTKSSWVNAKRVVHRFAGPFPCFDQFNTMAQVLDGAGVSWKYYATKLVGAGFWSAFEGIKYVRYGPDWYANIIAPQTQILTDPANGQLASVSWVTPSKADSDHPTAHSDKGPSWVASVVNAIGQSPYWNTSAIIVVWDDWGGWYDNAAPPQPDYRGLGIRVPCLIISPYAKQNYVTHTQLEFGSILKFMEEAFGLPPIGSPSSGYTDQRANSLDDAFNFLQTPRPFVPIQAKYPMSHFLTERPSNEPVDTQ